MNALTVTVMAIFSIGAVADNWRWLPALSDLLWPGQLAVANARLCSEAAEKVEAMRQ